MITCKVRWLLAGMLAVGLGMASSSCAPVSRMPPPLAKEDISKPEVQLTARVQRSFEEYQSSPKFRDFKAFAVDPSGVNWGRAWGYPSNPNPAIRRALRHCRKWSQKCEVYAIGNTVVLGMSPEQAEAVTKEYLATVIKRRKFLSGEARFEEEFRKRAELGDRSAQFLLGRVYQNGWWGFPKDFEEAQRWYLRAAKKGHAESQYRLGYMYVRGIGGVSQNNIQAHMWFNLAALQGFEDAAIRRDEIAKTMTPEEIAEAERLAAEQEP